MHVGQTDESQRSQDQDADAGAEIASVDADEKLEDDDDRDPAGGRIFVRVREHAEASRDQFLSGEQQRGAENQKRDETCEGRHRCVQQQHAAGRAAEERGNRQEQKPAADIGQLTAEADHRRKRSGPEEIASELTATGVVPTGPATFLVAPSWVAPSKNDTVPPPAIELIAPAAKAAKAMMV